MSYSYAVLGAGMQGTAAAFDLLSQGEGTRLLLLDQDLQAAEQAAERLRRLLPGSRIESAGLDASRQDDVRDRLVAVDGALSALPFGLNPVAARAAVEARTCFCDLGGNTAVVRDVLALDAEAREAGVSLVPDCGLAPGLGNQLAALGLARLPQARHVHVRCGGLPKRPRPPLDYMLVFNIGGLTNEYTGEAEALREGRRIRIPTLTELESVTFPEPLGVLEAFVTSGGTSTGPETWEGRLETYDYKTVRYPGHCAKVACMRDLGLLDREPVVVAGRPVVPREVFHACAAAHLTHQDDHDLVLLRVRLLDGSRSTWLQFDLHDEHDRRTGFSAMERCTAFPAAATLFLQVSGSIRPGAFTPERCTPPEEFLSAVQKRGIRVAESHS